MEIVKKERPSIPSMSTKVWGTPEERKAVRKKGPIKKKQKNREEMKEDEQQLGPVVQTTDILQIVNDGGDEEETTITKSKHDPSDLFRMDEAEQK